MRILGIDPGPTSSGVVLACNKFQRVRVLTANKALPNVDLASYIEDASPDLVVCEWVESFGLVVGKDVFWTVRWIGKFDQFCDQRGIQFKDVTRRNVKLTLCGTSTAKNKNVRQAVIDRFGGDEAIAPNKLGRSCPQCGADPGQPCQAREAPIKSIHKGRTRVPGPLDKVSSHSWSALALILTYLDGNPHG